MPTRPSVARSEIPSPLMEAPKFSACKSIVVYTNIWGRIVRLQSHNRVHQQSVPVPVRRSVAEATTLYEYGRDHGSNVHLVAFGWLHDVKHDEHRITGTGIDAVSASLSACGFQRYIRLWLASQPFYFGGGSPSIARGRNFAPLWRITAAERFSGDAYQRFAASILGN